MPSIFHIQGLPPIGSVDMEDFLREIGYLPANAEPEHMEDIKSIPVISWTQAGNWQEVCDTSHEDDYEEYVKTDTKGTFALRVRGDSMEPEFHDGDTIVINPFLKQEQND